MLSALLGRSIGVEEFLARATDFQGSVKKLACVWLLIAAGSLAASGAGAAGPTLYTTFVSPPGSNSIPQGQTGTYTAVLVKTDGTIVNPVAATWSITSGPASVNSSTGVVTGGAVSVNTAATLQASFNDAVLTGGVTVTTTRTLTIQASQDHWTGGTNPAQGGDARSLISAGSAGTDILVGIYGGGIRRSSNGGTSWNQSGYGIPGFGGAFVRSLRSVPGTSNVQILAAVEGLGIYRSSDSGASWTSSNTGIGCNFPRGFGAATPANTLYAAADCGVYRSSDGGQSWTTTALTQPTQSVTAFNSSTTVWAVMQGSLGLYRSPDSGTTWAPMNNGLTGSNGLFVESFNAPTTTMHLALVEGSGVFQTTTSGASWFAANSGLPAGKGFQGGFGSPGDGYIYVAVDGYGIYRGTTGASTSNPITWTAWGNTASQLPMRARPPSIIGGVYYVASGQGIFKSTDNGATWTKINTGLPGGYVRNVVTDPTNTNLVYTSADIVYKSSDGGTSWTPSNTGITGPISGFRFSGGNISRAGDGALYVSTADAGIFKSTDNAASWAPVNNGLPAIIGQGVSQRTDSINSQTLYALFGADPRGVYKTINGGANWTSISGNLSGNALYTRALVVDSATGSIYLGTNAGLYKSVNGGANWAPIYTGQEVEQIRVDTGTSPSTVYWATYVNDAFNVPQTASGVYRSADGGATYTQLLTGQLVNHLRVQRPGGSLVLTVASWNAVPGGGILRSTDGGATWQTINAGINNAFIGSFDVVNEEIVHATTRGNGVFTLASVAATQLLSVTNAGGGTVTSSLAGISCGATCSASFAQGAVVALTATPASGFSFGSWSGACSGSGACNLTMDAAKNVTATFVGGDTQAPSQPAGFTATAVNSAQVNLAWTASTDNVGVTQYKIYRNSLLLTTLSGTPPVSTYSDTSVAASTTYSYSVQACDLASNCSAQSAAASATTPAPGQLSFSAHLESGFNLIGNALNTLNVASTFGNQTSPVAGITANIVSVWTWNATGGRWAFNSPQLTVAGNSSYAASHNYDVLSTINPGEGYWVNAINPMDMPALTGTGIVWNSFNFSNLPSGFNLIASSNNECPSQFNNRVNPTPPAPAVIPTDNFVSLWAWNAVAGKWYFYSPLLESSGGLAAVCTYATTHFYLCFCDPNNNNKQLGNGTGFWVNKP